MEQLPDILLSIALGLGLLVGVQRTWADHEEAGARTFPLITLLGFVSGMLADVFGGWIIGAGMLGVAAMLVASNVGLFRKSDHLDFGVTTEMAALVMFGVGAILALAQRPQ